MPLPAVVLAHQQGLGKAAYLRQYNSLTVAIDSQYTIHGERRRSRKGKEIIMWHACTFGREIGEIFPSRYQSEVAAELRSYINQGGASKMRDLPSWEEDENV